MKLKILIVAAMFSLVGCGMTKMKEDGNAFMELMKAGDADKSFAMLDESVQKEVGGLEGWKKMLLKQKPEAFFFSGVQVNAGGTGSLKGWVDMPGKKSFDAVLSLKKYGDGYKITGINFTPQK